MTERDPICDNCGKVHSETVYGIYLAAWKRSIIHRANCKNMDEHLNYALKSMREADKATLFYQRGLPFGMDFELRSRAMKESGYLIGKPI